ncbi:hypothetical protein [Haloplanus sp. C73]|uniref:hypothetical protein n=1 Tax=Haloplanus sp. C73 TaxID=3421641 RepID=UPI003EBA4C45
MSGADRSSDESTAIASQEADETFQSITDLDSICDTMIVAITFLMSALGVWTGFGYGRLSGFPRVQLVFGALAALCMLATVLSVYHLSRSLFPRAFYGADVGAAFLDRPWVPFVGADSLDLSQFEHAADVDDVEALDREFEAWLDRYNPDIDIETHAQFERARLFNYKYVARIKALHTARGIAYLRIAAVFLLFLAVLSLAALPVADLL